MSGGDWGGITLLGAAYLILFASAELWARRGRPQPEWPRKLVHIGSGLISLLLPRFIASPWSVLAMAVFFSLFCLLGRRAGLLRCLGVRRASFGSELYPLSVFLVFAVARHQDWLYASSLLTLAVADAAAALVGVTFGKTRFTVDNETRSLEGSLVFLTLAFLAILLPMLWMSEWSPERCVLASFLAALLATGLEAISLRGVDNLLVPLGVCASLEGLAERPVEVAVSQVFLLSVLGILLIAVVRRSKALRADTALGLGVVSCAVVCGPSAWTALMSLMALSASVAAFLFQDPL